MASGDMVTLEKRVIPGNTTGGGTSVAVNIFFPYDPTPELIDSIKYFYGDSETVPEDAATLTERHRILDWGSAGTGAGQFDAPADVAVDSLDNVYVADTGNNRVQKFDKYRGNPVTLTTRQNDPLASPQGICVTESVTEVGTVYIVYIADKNNHRIISYNWSQAISSHDWDSGTALGTGLPIDVAVETVDGVTYVYVIEQGSNSVLRIRKDDLTQTAINGPANPAMSPSRIALYGETLYVTDTANNTVQKFTRNGGVFAYAESCGTPGTDEGELNSPTGICVYTDGRIFVCDKGENDNYRVQRFSASGPVAGAFEVAWGDATMFNFTGGAGIAVGTDGYIFVTDTGRNRIRRFQADNSLTFYGTFDGAETEVKITKINDDPVDPATFSGFDPQVRDTITAQVTYTLPDGPTVNYVSDFQEPLDGVSSRLFQVTWVVQVAEDTEDQMLYVVSSVANDTGNAAGNHAPFTIRILGLNGEERAENCTVQMEGFSFELDASVGGALYLKGGSECFPAFYPGAGNAHTMAGFYDRFGERMITINDGEPVVTGPRALLMWKAHILSLQKDAQIVPITVEYIGGTDPHNGQLEGYRALRERDYVMKGYQLKISLPDGLHKTQTPVMWSIKKAGQNVETGSYYEDGLWPHYRYPLGNAPTDAVIYWRSDILGNINDQYVINATFVTPNGKQGTATRRLQSQLLTPKRNAPFSADADMLQRAMIQIFYLDKGRLEEYRIGVYDDFTQGGYYRSSLNRTVKPWSAIADEIQNTWIYGIGKLDPDRPKNREEMKKCSLPIIKFIWDQFDMILAAGEQPAQDRTTQSYNGWSTTAAANLNTVLQNVDFPKSGAEVLDALVHQEGGNHSWEKSPPLAVSSVDIAQVYDHGNPTHTWTDAGIGYCKIQPYNAGEFNVYSPMPNLQRGAKLLNDSLSRVRQLALGDPVWFALVAYNGGFSKEWKANTQPSDVRASSRSASALYADTIYDLLGLARP